jgi:eukaryotic-like serine/threonine-protein kinase
MALVSGARLGPYEIQSPLGAGGMGEVYRARDTRLGREVAVKVLPAAFSRDPERLRRFQQEAQAVAALNHPNILAIHDFGEHEGSPYIVTELLEGETLRSRVQAGAMPVRKATEIAEQIARGLAAAHDKGIVHRDLKPENIFITRDGRVKILDFGLAKLAPEAVTPDSATLASRTEPGVVMGTVGYMSPEQVRGQTADHRSDLFSFGTILYEMLFGTRAFHGDTSVEIMNAILKQEPAEDAGSCCIPPALRRIVGHCLEKNPVERFQSARDVAFALGALSGSVSSATTAIKVESPGAWWPHLRIAVEAALVAAVIILSWLLTRRTSEAPNFAMVAAVTPPPGEGFWADITQPAAISPDGKFLALIAMHNAHTQLWLRRLDSAEAQPVAGSEDARDPFWSPDGRYIAFFVPGKLKKVDISGGAVDDICQAGFFAMGGTWSPRGIIVFATLADALKQVPDRGGVAQAIPGTEPSPDSVGQMWPAFLPGGKHFLYLEWKYPTLGRHDDGVWIGSLEGEKAQRLPLSSTNVQYASGHLLFMQDGDLVAQKFDPSQFELSGAPFPVARGIQYDTFFHDGMFTAANNGMLVFGTVGTGVNTELTWLDRNGKAIGILGGPDQFLRQAISPDGKRIAVGVKHASERENIWIYDVDRGTRIPLETGESGGELYSPTWSPDGKLIAYRSLSGTKSTLLFHASDGSGEEKRGFQADLITVTSWSLDGHYIATETTKYEGRENWKSFIRVVRAESADKPVLEIENADGGKFSPDGHWLAYSDNGSGEVYVTPFPGPGAKIAVSSKGGKDPRWRGDGQELFYVAEDQTLMSVQARESPQEVRVLSSKPLFRLQLPWNAGFYDVTRDGKRFLVNIRTHKEQAAPLTVVTNWTALVRNESK